MSRVPPPRRQSACQPAAVPDAKALVRVGRLSDEASRWIVAEAIVGWM
jgi:hypothetical protein